MQHPGHDGLEQGVSFGAVEVLVDLDGDVGGPVFLRSGLAVDELPDVGVLPMHDGHAGGAPGSAGDHGRGDEVVDGHGVEAGKLLADTAVQQEVDAEEHLHQGVRTTGRAAEGADGGAGGADARHVDAQVTLGHEHMAQGLDPALAGVGHRPPAAGEPHAQPALPRGRAPVDVVPGVVGAHACTLEQPGGEERVVPGEVVGVVACD